MKVPENTGFHRIMPKNVQVKPRIARLCGMWTCGTGDESMWTGIGITPWLAYIDWSLGNSNRWTAVAMQPGPHGK